jgi:Ca2+-transporting ATPase
MNSTPGFNLDLAGLASRAHAVAAAELLRQLGSSNQGLSGEEARHRLQQYGKNVLPRARPPGFLVVFLRQFRNPLIYILGIAAVISGFLGEFTDAGFILGVLLLNAIVGAVQEYQAQRQAEALQQLVRVNARVQRDSEAYEIDSEDLVPGDIVLLESGDKVPGDIRLVSEQGLDVDESLLTGESLPAVKDTSRLCPLDTPLGDRANMVFAGTLVSRGRARGVVVGTAGNTELGHLAQALEAPTAPPPLMQRMSRFTTWIGIAYLAAVFLIAGIALLEGQELYSIFLLAVALAVAAIPEGLPVAITVALSVGMARMARCNVIVRRLVAAETLGSCTMIAADKTGTLTVNELTARRIHLPGEQPVEVTGHGMVPEGELRIPETASPKVHEMSEHLARAAILCNEGFLGRRDGEWVHHGDAVDVALLVLAQKLGLSSTAVQARYPQIATIPFESERMYAASMNRIDGRPVILVKGASETVLPMCDSMLTAGGKSPLAREELARSAENLAADGYRVLAIAESEGLAENSSSLGEDELHGLVFLGFVAMIDPPRPEAEKAIASCRGAGIRIAMVTGDHPATSLAIAREIGLARDDTEVVTGTEFRQALKQGDGAVDDLLRGRTVFARVEPRQKYEIVRALVRQGEFVAVTGDGANDAPALRAAHVGVAMGKQGTAVARESAELIITDDNIASLVAGVTQGRIAYANVRKVIFLLLSTGAVEIAIFVFALAAGMPLPLTAIQLLWLNLVTEGIQDVGLAFEPGEGDEMERFPRSPREPLFDRSMVERIVLSAFTMGALAFAVFWWAFEYQGMSLEAARNLTLLLMVLFENIQVFNSRSETRSVFRHNPWRNRILLLGTMGAQAVHIAAMYTPGLSTLLQASPVTLVQWLELLLVASSILVVMEIYKLYRRKYPLSAAGSRNS